MLRARDPKIPQDLTSSEANWQLTTSREAVRESLENYQLRSQAPDKLGASDQPGMSRILGDWMCLGGWELELESTQRSSSPPP